MVKTTTNPSVPLRLTGTAHPVMYEVNTRVLMHELSEQAGTSLTLGEMPDSVLDGWAALGIDAVWLMGVWTTGALGRQLALDSHGLQDEYRKSLPDVTPEDILGSPYAVQEYRVAPAFGGGKALRTLRTRLAERGIGLVLDYVSNHTARDHAWVKQHPEHYIHSHPAKDSTPMTDGFIAQTSGGELMIAFGRDPMFPGWTDTAQLNPCSKTARAAMIAQLEEISAVCDGVRCDMAMLLLADVFERTWGERSNRIPEDRAEGEFWREAIATVTEANPGFLFIAEAYWSREWDLQQLGFNYTYDKTLYDRLLREGASAVRDHLKADILYQTRSLRFLENHDEERAARLLPSEAWQYAAATVVATVPGLFLLHDGQMEGRNVRVPVQLRRRVAEVANARSQSFYTTLLELIDHPVFRKGTWRLLSIRPAWHDNHTWHNIISYWWHHPEHGNRFVVVNYAPHTGQAYVDVPLELMEGHLIEFKDLLGGATYARERVGLHAKGMYFDLAGYGIHIFDVSAADK
jgi:hypothetical protein